MQGQSVRIVHGYGDSPIIIVDQLKLQNVKSYSVRGEEGKLPELTVTLNVASIVFDDEKKKGE